MTEVPSREGRSALTAPRIVEHRGAMVVYRSIWRASVAVLVAVALVAAGAGMGWFAVLSTASWMAATGAFLGFALVQEPNRRRRAVGGLTVWFAAGAVLVLGLPVLFGLGSLVIAIGIGGLCPPLVERAVYGHRLRRPVPTPEHCQRLSDGELKQRWLRTSQEVRDRRADLRSVVALVEERSMLLDEVERRDPRGFAAILVRAGCREPQDQ